jgi:hypothetical protein
VSLTFIMLGIPALVIVGLSLLSPGRVALAGLMLGVAAAYGSLFWPGDDSLGYGRILSAFLAMSVTVATVVQMSRHLRRELPMFALFVMLVLVAGLAIFLLRSL